MDNASRVSCRDSSQRFIAASPSAVDRRFAGLLSSILSYLVQAFLYRCSVYQSHKRCGALSPTLFDETVQTWRRVVPTSARNPNTLFPGPNPTPTLETRFDACDYYVDTRIAHHSRTRTLNTQLLRIPVMSPQRTTDRGRRSKPPPVAPVVHTIIYTVYLLGSTTRMQYYTFPGVGLRILLLGSGNARVPRLPLCDEDRWGRHGMK